MSFAPFGRRLFNRRAVLAGLASLTAVSKISASPAGTTHRIFDLDLSHLEARIGGRLGVVAQRGDHVVQWRPAERFAYCSTFKLFLAAATLQRCQLGLDRLDRELEIRASDLVSHAPVTEPAVGGKLTLEQLCKGAVEVSDNPAANILIRELGGLEAWGQWYREIGDGVTRVDRPETELNTALLYDERDTTTPSQTVSNLEAVLLGDMLDVEYRTRLERWLVDTPTGAGRILAGVADEHRVGHKTGTGENGTANDIGIVWHEPGPPILLAIYLTQATKADAQSRDAVIADATREAIFALSGT